MDEISPRDGLFSGEKTASPDMWLCPKSGQVLGVNYMDAEFLLQSGCLVIHWFPLEKMLGNLKNAPQELTEIHYREYVVVTDICVICSW